MSLVVFPFKDEDPTVVINKLWIAAEHSAVTGVLCVGVEEGSTFAGIESVRGEIAGATGTPMELMLRDRIGSKRPGKGDNMNTALRFFLTETDVDRIHFYDSDITSFGPDWISRAEVAADRGFDVVRHFFPRSSTDAMITWMITRPGFAILWPDSELPRIEQPLGGELLFRRSVVEHLVADERVQAQSDWGIDTLFTFATTQAGFSVYETYVPQGKVHALYDGLTDLRTMLIECFSAVQSLTGERVDKPVEHRIEEPGEAPPSIAEKIGYNLEVTLHLLTEGWTDGQAALLDLFPETVRHGMLANRHQPTFLFMDEEAWYLTYRVLLDRFVLGDPDWEALLFRLWITRVINYTSTRALRGYAHSQSYLNSTIGDYQRRSAATR